MIQSLSRREVIKTIFVTSAFSIINNKLWAAKVVSEVTANEIHGVCTRGPAPIGVRLNSYPTSVANGILTIEIADQGFSFTQEIVTTASDKRIKLSWDALEFVEYEVRYRPDYATEPVRMNC